jgi:hypothetical protein
MQCNGLKKLTHIGTVLIGIGNINTRAQNDHSCSLFWVSLPVLAEVEDFMAEMILRNLNEN